jgi:hypothetical protein
MPPQIHIGGLLNCFNSRIKPKSIEILRRGQRRVVAHNETGCRDRWRSLSELMNA